MAIVTSFATSWLNGTSTVAEGFRVARASDVASRRSGFTESKTSCVNPLGTLTSFDVVNGGQTPLRNFADWTLVARYLTSSATTVQTLAYTNSDPPAAGKWTIDEIRMKNGSNEVFNPGVIDPGEEAIIAVNFSPGVWASSANLVSLTTDTGNVATIDFAGQSACRYYLHNNLSPPTGNTNQQANLTADGTFPGQTTLYNYDQYRDASAGPLIVKGGSGAGESDLTKYQDWRTGALGEDLKLSGTVRVHLWAAVKSFSTSATGSVTVYLRDFNGATSTEIANSTLTAGPWDAAASGTWVPKTVSIAAVNYAVPAGNRLEVKLIVDTAAGADMHFAFDTTSYPSTLALPGVIETSTAGSPTTETVNPGAGTGRFTLPTNSGKYVFPLYGYNIVTNAIWTVSYRVKREAYGFRWFTNAYDVTPGTQNAWTNVNLSSYVALNATGAVIELVNLASGNSYSAVVRGTTDTRDYQALYNERIENRTHRWQMVKVDSSRRIDAFVENTTNVKLKLLGYTIGTDPKYWDSPPDITPILPLTWSVVDVSAYVDSDATGVILLVDNGANASNALEIRETGSSFSATNRELSNYGNTMYVVGLDSSKRFDAYVQLTTTRIFLIGQTKSSVSFYVNDVGVANPTLGSWQKIDADNYAVPSAANGLFLYANNPDGSKREVAFRHGDSTDNWARKDVWANGDFQAGIGLNSANEWGEFLEVATTNVQIAAYTIVVSPGDADVHLDVDVLVRKANGEIKAILGTDVANTSMITAVNWVTMTATTTFAEYTVVDPTDYLEIDVFAHVTRNVDTASAITYFRIDDAALVPTDRTRITGVGLYRE
jgi:hypothetical protein